MFKKHTKRSPNILFVIFRLCLSMMMFALLLGGSYSAYKHFSGLDPLKLDPQAVLKNALAARSPDQLIAVLSSINPKKVLGQSQTNNQGLSQNLNLSITPTPSPSRYIFRFLLITDTHNDNVKLKQAISQAKASYSDISFIIGLGDYTEVGTIEELKEAKKELDSSGLRYFLLPGDHDLWDARNRSLSPNLNFKEVFGPSYQSFVFDQFRFILLFNSDNYQGLDEEQLKWLSDEIEKGKTEQSKGIYVFVHEPLYHPSSDHVMGRVEQSVKSQAKRLVYQLKEAGVRKVFAGDTHYFSEYEEPETKLSMMTSGAVTTERNPQTSRFSVVYIFEDGSAKAEDIEIR